MTEPLPSIELGGYTFRKHDDGCWYVDYEDGSRELSSVEFKLLETAVSLREQLASYAWEPGERAAVKPGTTEHALIGWRSRCLRTEKKLGEVLAELGKVRQDWYDLKTKGEG